MAPRRTDLHAVVFHGNADARQTIVEYEWCGVGGAAVTAKTLSRPAFDVCITTYETFALTADLFRKVVRWGYVILDEAHRLKNKLGKVRDAIPLMSSCYVLPSH